MNFYIVWNDKQWILLFIVKPGSDSPSVEFKELLENEKSNFRLINTAVSFLGGVPAMINPADMSNTIPNEKVRCQTQYNMYIRKYTSLSDG